MFDMCLEFSELQHCSNRTTVCWFALVHVNVPNRSGNPWSRRACTMRASSLEVGFLWKAILFALLMVAVPCGQGKVIVKSVRPTRGSLAGGTRVHIQVTHYMIWTTTARLRIGHDWCANLKWIKNNNHRLGVGCILAWHNTGCLCHARMQTIIIITIADLKFCEMSNRAQDFRPTQAVLATL